MTSVPVVKPMVNRNTVDIKNVCQLLWSIAGCDRAIPKILIGRESDILSDKSNSYELLGKDIKIAG